MDSNFVKKNIGGTVMFGKQFCNKLRLFFNFYCFTRSGTVCIDHIILLKYQTIISWN